jgi:hypothetical protein
MELLKIRVELWLDDLAEATQGHYKKSYDSQGTTHEVRNENGIIQIKWNKHTNKFIHCFWDENKKEFIVNYINDFIEFTEIANSIK